VTNQAGDLIERAGLLEQVSGGQPRGGRIRAGVEQPDPQLIAAEEGGQPRRRHQRPAGGDMLRTNQLPERR
jgi:hypothetical protein